MPATNRSLTLPRLRGGGLPVAAARRLGRQMGTWGRRIGDWWKRRDGLGFAARLGLAVSLLILITCIAEAWILARRELGHVRRYLSDRGRAVSEELARDAGTGVFTGNTQALRQLAEQAGVQRGILYSRFFDRNGLLLVSVGTLPGSLARPEAAARKETVGPLQVGTDVWEFQAPVFAPGAPAKRGALLSWARGGNDTFRAFDPAGTVAIGLALDPLAALRRRTFMTGTVFTSLFTAMAVLCALALARAIARPLKKLATAADQIARGDLEARVDVTTRDEIGALAHSFNAMAESLTRNRATLEEKVLELEKANHLKSEFLATISHELRTPLNVILGYTEMLIEGTGGTVNEAQAEMLRAIRQYSEVQLGLITSVLDFSRLSAGGVSFRVERFALGPLLKDVAEVYEARLAQRPVRVTVSVDPELPLLETDRTKLQEIVRNLVDNAVKFVEEGTISVVGKRSGRAASVVIEVNDTGPGIAPEDVPFVFDAFHQSGDSSTRQTGGLGLGLSIVRHLAEALGGTASVTTRLGEGSSFRIEIPRTLPPPQPAQPDPATAIAALDDVARNAEAVPLRPHIAFRRDRRVRGVRG